MAGDKLVELTHVRQSLLWLVLIASVHSLSSVT